MDGQPPPGSASWRDSASAEAQDELDGLLNVALEVAQQQLQRHGELYPYAVALGADGKAQLIATESDDDEHPSSAEAIASCLAALMGRRESIRASGIVSDVRVPALGGDAVRVDLEHREGQSLTVLLPYASGGGPAITVTYGEIQASGGLRQVWA